MVTRGSNLPCTHQIEEALAICDRLAVMAMGRLIQVGPKEELLSNPKDEFVRRYLRVRR